MIHVSLTLTESELPECQMQLCKHHPTEEPTTLVMTAALQQPVEWVGWGWGGGGGRGWGGWGVGGGGSGSVGVVAVGVWVDILCASLRAPVGDPPHPPTHIPHTPMSVWKSRRFKLWARTLSVYTERTMHDGGQGIYP